MKARCTHRRACEIGGPGRSVVAEGAKLAETVLDLGAQRRVCMGPFVAQGVPLEDPNGREDGDRADDQNSGEELESRATSDGWLGAAPADGRDVLSQRLGEAAEAAESMSGLSARESLRFS